MSYKIPENAPPATKEWLRKLSKINGPRDGSLVRIRDHFEGGDRAISETYFPRPEGVHTTDWRQLRRLYAHVNLVRPSARCWSAAVYSGDVQRDVTEAPHKPVIKEFIKSPEYTQAIEAWNENAIVYGTAVAVPCYDYDEESKTGELSIWLPDPLYTWIETDPVNVRKITAVIEINPKCQRVMYIRTDGMGWMTKDNSEHQEMDFGWLPVAVAYGQSCLHRGEKYGISLVRDAVDWSIRCTDVAFNISILQKLQTRATLVIIGQEDMADDENSGHGPNKELKLRPESDAKYISPDAKIKETIEILKQMIGLLATSTSIPQDVLDATLTQQVSSAEAARIRAIPLVQRARQLVPIWRANEHNLIMAIEGLLEYNESKNPVKYADLKNRVKTDIQITPNIIPMSRNEEVQNVIALLQSYLITAEDAVRTFNQSKTEDDIKAMADKVREVQEKESAQAMAQQALKQSAKTKPPEKRGDSAAA